MNDSAGTPGRSAPRRDRTRSDQIVAEALAASTIYGPSQKENVWRMADDLTERRSVWSSVPFRIEFEFNRRCNIKCVHCDIQRANTGSLPVAVFERLMDQIGWGSIELMPFVGGEPTLAPLAEIAQVLRRHNHYLNLITNGILFDRACFEGIADVAARVQFSFHSHRREVFDRIMPGAGYDRVLQNLRDAVRVAEQTGAHIVPTVVAMDDNVEELEDYLHFVADLGINRLIIQKLYPHTESFAELEPGASHSPEALHDLWEGVLEVANERRVFLESCVQQLFRRQPHVPFVKSRFDLLQENADIVNLYCPEFCISTAIQTIVEWDGTVLPCVRDRIVLGNLNETPFLELWNGPVMQRLRRSLFDGCPSANCAECRKFWNGHP
jgi:MoaA/NifB/PqqE/SkfB family radical SAM enzyme